MGSEASTLTSQERQRIRLGALASMVISKLAKLPLVEYESGSRYL